MICIWVGLVILFLWIYLGLFVFMFVMGWKWLFYSVVFESNCCEFNIIVEYFLLSLIVNFVLFMLFMCVLYWRIYKIVSGMVKEKVLNFKENLFCVGWNFVRSFKKRIKIIKNILFVVCIFFFCWMLYIIFSMVIMVMLMMNCILCLYVIFGEFNFIFLMLGYLSLVLNLYLYVLRNKKFRNVFLSVVFCLRCKFV